MEEKQKKLRLMSFWLFASVLIVFAAVTTYIYVWIGPLSGTIWMALKAALPITLIIAVAAVIIYVVYYYLVYKKA
ncbi:MAG TPA: hypothetical protein PLJ78_08765 [Anaerolineae bacterium]|nr:hypothetical protein [Anaerolineae bacterium]HQK14016.1 hypothetical protein [Anaerolineae bacterium]